jgi:hypothetical protein
MNFFRNHKRSHPIAATLIYFALLISSAASYAQIGDRIICVINTVPYTQLQLEAYLNVKESLRADPENSELVSSTNWTQALDAFSRDMIIYQESARSTGFRPSNEIMTKAFERVQKTVTEVKKFEERFESLSIRESQIREQLAKLLAIENIRKSRHGSTPGNTESQQWEADLIKSAVIRWYDKSQTYQTLNPHKVPHAR